MKLPSGAEFEAEGSPEFVAGERREFLATTQDATGAPTQKPSAPQPAQAQIQPTGPAQAGAAGSPEPMMKPLEPDWDELIENRGPDIQLRAKLKGGGNEKEACLILLAASQRVLRLPKPTAAQLARWLRASGYPIQRVDRTIQDCLENGDILASGSRRGRRYALSSPGLAKAFNLALQLGATLRPASKHHKSNIFPGQIEMPL